jgi:flagellar basal-body rod modification protein FlgD
MNISDIASKPVQTATLTDTVQQEELGRDAFLKLLTVQLQNQDPMEPVKNEDFVAQLSQFSSLEQLTSINQAVSGKTETEALGGVMQAVESNTAISLMGKTVEIPTETLTYTGQGAVEIGYHLGGDANRVDIEIFDADGNLARTLVDNTPSEGNSTLVWDGTNDTGQSLSAGEYYFVPKAVNGEGNGVTIQAQLQGKVTGVRYEGGKPILILDGGEAPLSGVARISQTE